LPLMQARLRSFVEKGVSKNCWLIMEAADKIISRIDSDSLLKSIGARVDLSEDAASNKTENEKTKSILIEALVTKGMALVDVHFSHSPDGEVPPSFLKTKVIPVPKPSNEQPAPVENGETDKSVDIITETATDSDPKPVEPKPGKFEVSLKAIDDVFVELVKFVDPSDLKAASFCAKQAVAHKHYGRALHYLRRALEEKSIKEMDQMCFELYEQLGWFHVSKVFKQSILLKYPASYRLF